MVRNYNSQQQHNTNRNYPDNYGEIVDAYNRRNQIGWYADPWNRLTEQEQNAVNRRQLAAPPGREEDAYIWRRDRPHWQKRWFQGADDLSRNPFAQSGPGAQLANFYQTTQTDPHSFDVEWGMNQPLVAMSLLNTPEYSRMMSQLEDYGNVMQQYGVGAGQLAASAQAGATAGKQRLGAMGLGRSAASSAIDNAAMMNAQNQQAGLRTQLYQQQQQQRMAARQAQFGALQGITQLALGQDPARLITPDGPDKQDEFFQQAKMLNDGLNPFAGGNSGGQMIGAAAFG